MPPTAQLLPDLSSTCSGQVQIGLTQESETKRNTHTKHEKLAQRFVKYSGCHDDPIIELFHVSYGQNLVHGEGTSLSRVGPYRFCSGGTLYKHSWGYHLGYRFRVGPYRFLQQWQPHDPLNTTWVIPNFVRYSCLSLSAGCERMKIPSCPSHRAPPRKGFRHCFYSHLTWPQYQITTT